jgi:DNA-binding protein HU-beta
MVLRRVTRREVVNKAELIDAITERLGDKRAASHAVEAVVDTITRAVAKGEKVAITGFGVFERQVRGARTVRNPATGASIKKKKTAVPKFRPGAGFKQVVSGEKKLAAPAKSTAAASKRSTSGTTTTGRKATGAKTTASKSTARSASKATTAKTAAKSTTRSTAKTAAKSASGRSTAAKSTARGGASKTTAKRTTTRKASAAKR